MGSGVGRTGAPPDTPVTDERLTELHAHAAQDFAGLVAGVAQDAWSRPTPCSEWDVRELVNHVVAEDRWTPELLGGRTIAEVGARFDGDLLGSDAPSEAMAAAQDAVAAVARFGALDRTVQLSFGEVPAREYVWQLFADHLIHRWDLAVAIGADRSLPEDQVQACAVWFETREADYRRVGVKGPSLPVPDEADAQRRLLAAFGRDGGTDEP